MSQFKKFARRNRVENPDLARSKVLHDTYLSSVYLEILKNQLKSLAVHNSRVIEIGSAGGITKEFYGEITTSDVRHAEGVDLIIDATTPFPFPNNSVDRLLAKDVLHHIANPITHFAEVERILKHNGSAIYAEPNWNLVSRFVFRFIHPEPWISKGDWTFETNDPMFANQALPWILFVRDRKKFEVMFPGLEIQLQPIPLNGVAFLLSGGVFRRTIISSSLLIKIDKWEQRHQSWMTFFGLTRIILIRKK